MNFDSLFQIHRIQTMELPEVCTVCPKQFLRKPELRNHMKLVHDCNPASHNCPICFKGFRLLDYLKAYMQIHAVEPPHKCELRASKGFKKSDLNFHVQKVCENQIPLYQMCLIILNKFRTPDSCSGQAWTFSGF